MISGATKTEQAPLAVRNPLRTLLVDDSREFLGRLEKWLFGLPDFEIIGEAYSGFEAIKLSRMLRPDLVVMDVAMPLMNGYEATVRMKEGVHRPTVILISFFERCAAHEGSDLNADAFIKKDSLYEELLPTVARLFPQRRTEAVL
jgi:two-component system, NarL family, nitrate/nitrite response regulator NarL